MVTPKGKLKVAVSTHTWDGAEEEEAVEYFATHCSGLLRSSIRLCRKDDGHNGHNKPLSVSTMKFGRNAVKSWTSRSHELLKRKIISMLTAITTDS